MRLSFDLAAGRQIAIVTLSGRNLAALLQKLEMPGSLCTLASEDAPEGWALVVNAEHDETHYRGRPFPPGPMHPTTEAFLMRLQAVLDEASEGDSAA